MRVLQPVPIVGNAGAGGIANIEDDHTEGSDNAEHNEDLAELAPGDKEHDSTEKDDRRSSRNIGLEEDQQCDNRNNRKQREETIRPLMQCFFFTVQPETQINDHRKFSEF